MIILDTNVVSEPMRARSDTSVVSWINLQKSEELFITSTILAELLTGVEIMPDGRRKADIERDVSKLVDMLFGPRVLPFDQSCARYYARIIGRVRHAGRTIAFGDAQIAAVAAHHGFAVATRDTAPFEAAGVPVIDPWTA